MSRTVARVVSGGQTGVDRAALDAGRAAGLLTGGWCPAGGYAEDAPAPPGVRRDYPELVETPSAEPGQRTVWNVRDSHATLVLVVPESGPSPGTATTLQAARELGRPHLVCGLHPTDLARDLRLVRDWFAGLPREATLNVAGPRASEAASAYPSARRLLDALLAGALDARTG